MPKKNSKLVYACLNSRHKTKESTNALKNIVNSIANDKKENERFLMLNLILRLWMS